MQIEISHSTLNLARNGLIVVRDGKDSRVLCKTGALWITQECDIRDIVIEAGQSFTIRTPGLTLVTALQDAAVTLIEPQHRRLDPWSSSAGGMSGEPAPCT